MVLQLFWLVVAFGFIALTVFICGIGLHQLNVSLTRTNLKKEQKKSLLLRTYALTFIWVLSLSALSLLDVTSRFSWFPVNVIITLLFPLAMVLYISFNSKSRELLRHTPVTGLTYLHTYRLVVGLLLWMLFLNNRLPLHLTFEGKNYDILAGLTAPVVVLAFAKRKIVMIFWNLLALALLLNFMLSILFSSPSPVRLFHEEPSSAVLFTFPYVFLPGILIPMALMLHLLTLRKLWTNGHLQD